MLKGIEVGMGKRLADEAKLAGNAIIRAKYKEMRDIRQMITPSPIETAKQAKQLRQLIQKHSPVDTGALKRSWNDPRTVQVLPDGQVQIDNPLPYARIQDLGGVIYRTSSKGKGYTIRIKAQHYVKKALREYNSSPAAEFMKLKEPTFGAGGAVLFELIKRIAQPEHKHAI